MNSTRDIRKATELNILRSALDNAERMDILLNYTPDIFVDDFMRRIFEMFIDFNAQDKKIDTVALYSAMPLYGFHQDEIKGFIAKFSKAAGSMHINDLIGNIINQNSIEHARCFSTDIVNGIEKKELTLEEIKNKIDELNQKIELNLYVNHDIHIQKINETPMDDIFIKSDFLRYGIKELDDNLIGMFNGQLIVIASRPGLGKSTLAMQIAQHQKGTSYFISREMKVKKLYARNLSFFSDVESWKIEFKKCNNEEIRRVMDARIKIKESGINIIFNDKLSDYKKIIKQANRIPDLKLLIIDYLQLLRGADSKQKNEYIGEMTTELKDYANTRNIPILLLSQLNRNLEYSDREPELQDLKASGDIEQDADIVLFIWKKRGSIEQLDEIFFIVAKNRDGKTDIKIPTSFERKYYRFGNKFESKQTEMDWTNN
jgi:replicative DNA helicase